MEDMNSAADTMHLPNQQSSGCMKLLECISDFVDRICTFSFVLATIALVGITLFGVFFRYVLNDSLVWADEAALMVFLWATCLSIASGYLHDKHVTLDLFVQKLTPIWNARVSVAAEGLSLGYLLALTLSCFEYLPLVEGMRTDALRWPCSIPFMAILVACVIMLVHWPRRNFTSGFRLTFILKLMIGGTFLLLMLLPIGQYVEVTGYLRGAMLLAALFVPMLLGVPVALALGLMATFYVGTVGDVPFTVGAEQVFNGFNIIALMAIPLLMLAGKLMHEAGIAKFIVDFAQVLVGRVRGGLGAANVIASFIFGDISGSAVSDTAAIGSLMIPQMKKRGYMASFCAALQGTSGTLGMMAPLSITLLLYAAATNTSVSRLAAASVVPAFLLAGSFIVLVLIHARRNNYPREIVDRTEYLPRTVKALPGLMGLVFLASAILGGVCTPAEVGGLLVGYVTILAIFYRKAKPKNMYQAVVEAGHISGMTLFMAATSGFLGFVLARDLVPKHVLDFVTSISTENLAVIFMVSFVFFVLGMFLEPPAMIFGFLPSFLPLLATAHVDPVHWGVLLCTNMGLGMITPPVALNLFITAQLADVPFAGAVRATVPFMIIMVVDILIIATFPAIPLGLPHIIFGYPIP